MPKVNPEILVWARETAGLTAEEAAEKLRIQASSKGSPVERLIGMESGKEEPTRSILSRMAKQYRRPAIMFYLPHKPKEDSPLPDFRALPTQRLNKRKEALLSALVRDMRVRQSILRAAMEDDDEEDLEPAAFVGSCRMDDGKRRVLDALKSVLGMELAEYRTLKKGGKAFQALRSKAEAAGAFVLTPGNLGSSHTRLDVDVFRGFCLADEIAPFIVINPFDAKTAHSFTLLHEMTHLLLGNSGVSSVYSGVEVEQFCNSVAGEYLLPSEEMSALKIRKETAFHELTKRVEAFADERRLSPSMVAYKALLLEKIGSGDFSRLQRHWRGRWLAVREERRAEAKKEKPKIDFNRVQKSQLGASLVEQVRLLTQSGALSTVRAGQVLGAHPLKVHRLFDR